MPFIPRSKTQILNSQIESLQENTPINNLTPGSRARAILHIVSSELASFERLLDYNTANSFVSSAYGVYLDYIGELVNCTRLFGETDENYRYRIVHQIPTLANANEIAIRTACLATEGVKDVILQPFTNGAGTFSVYVIAENPNNQDAVIARVQSVLNEKQAYGINGFARAPRLIELRIELEAAITAGADYRSLNKIIKDKVYEFVNTLDLGATLYINQLERAILNISSNIRDVQITSMHANGSQALIQNYVARSDEKFSISYQHIILR
jgi:uncharacterized phage protein gp47/JayE